MHQLESDLCNWLCTIGCAQSAVRCTISSKPHILSLNCDVLTKHLLYEGP